MCHLSLYIYSCTHIQKRNILAVHIAKQLSQKKHRSKVGAVHLTNVFGDSRKVGLVLTPPLDEEDETKKKKDGKKQKKKEKKRKHDDDEEEDEKKKGGKKKNNKLRFRIRLIFGVKPADQGSTSSGQTHDDEEEYSTDEESTTAFNNSWIPSSRLLPNRSNITNRSTKHNNNNNNDDTASITNATPHYTNALAEDLHLLSTTNLISSTVDTLTSTSGSSNNSISPKSSFHETLLLLKVWALQRGLLRGHDTFTTTTLATLLVYLYRTKVIGKRMGGVQGFIAFMKFWSETDWLGDDYDLSKKSSDNNGSTTSTSTAAATAVRGRKLKNKVAFVIPTMGSTESSTIAHCPQSRLYQDDVRGITAADGTTPKTLLDCFKAVYTSLGGDDHYQDSPILLDPTMTINYLARLSPSFVRESRSEACLALRYIHGYDTVDNGGSIRMDEGSGGAFRKLFLETNRFWNRYDAYVRVPLSMVPKIITTGGSGSKKKKHGKGGGSSYTAAGATAECDHSIHHQD